MMLSRATSPTIENSTKAPYLSAWLIVFLLLVAASLNAQMVQKLPSNSANGKKYYDMGNMVECVRVYEDLLKKSPDNVEYHYLLAISYANSHIDKKKAIEHIEFVLSKDELPKDAYLEAGIIYHKNYRFDEALKYFQKFQEGIIDDEEAKALVKRWISSAETAKKLVAQPVPVRFENLGKRVNSKAPDYLPFVTPREDQLLFTTRRDGVVGGLYDFLGYRPPDIYLAKHKSSGYSRARSIGTPNTYGNEETAGASENGKYMIYHIDRDDNFSDLFVSEMGRRSYMPAKVFDSFIINGKESEDGGSLTDDGNKLYFASNRKGGEGGFDIYWVRRLPNGQWAEPMNAGPSINTPGDERYPMISGDDQSLYFCSNGLPGMGELDIFKTERIGASEKWSKPKNLGYPINTVDDDLSISFPANKRYAYVAAHREDSYGDLDIYRLTFLEEKQEYTLVYGKVMNTDSTAYHHEASIEAWDAQTEDLFGVYAIHAEDGRFQIIFPVGKYRLDVLDEGGTVVYTKDMNIRDKSNFKPKQRFDIIVGAAPATSNTPKK